MLNLMLDSPNCEETKEGWPSGMPFQGFDPEGNL